MQTVKLSDVCTIVSGSTPKTDEPAFWNGTLKWVTPAELRDDTIFVTDTERHITEAAARSAHLTPFPAGTVLLSSRAPIGKTAIAGAEMYCNQGFKNLICSDRINNRYLYYFLTSRTRYLNDLGRGATFKEISKTIVENIEIPLPPLAEQQRIVRELQQVGALLANRRQVDEKLAELPKARFVEMFGDPVVNPRGWEKHPLENIAEVGSSKRVFTDELLADGIPFFRGTEIGLLAEGTAFRPELYISPNHYHKLCEGSGKPARGDLLLPSICPDGRIWLVDTDQPFYFKDGRVLWISKISERTDSVFVQHVLKFIFAADYDRIASGTTFKELKIFVLKKLPIPLPPLDLQRRFAAFARACAAQRAACARQIAVLETLRGKLLQDAFGAAG